MSYAGGRNLPEVALEVASARVVTRHDLKGWEVIDLIEPVNDLLGGYPQDSTYCTCVETQGRVAVRTLRSAVPAIR